MSVVMEMRNGAAAMDCSKKFNELLQSILETRKGGKLTLTVTVKPATLRKDGSVGELDLAHNCSIAKPELEQGRSIFFVTQDGRVTRSDPNQLGFFEEKPQDVKETK
jgi:hypothetical protein